MNHSSTKIESVVSSMIEIFKILQASGIHDHTGEKFQFLYWDRSMDDNQRKARQLMDRVVDIVIHENTLVSQLLVYERLLFDIVLPAVYSSRDPDNVKSELEQMAQKLFNYDVEREVDIPLVHLEVGTEPVKFGLATFYSMTEKDREDGWLTTFVPANKKFLDIGVTSYARVTGRGDLIKAKEDADRIVCDMLTFLRAVGFPISTKPQIQFGIINEYSFSQMRPYRSGSPKANYRLEPDITNSWKLGPPLRPYSIRNDLLSALDEMSLEELQKLIENDYRKPKTKMRRKFLSGLHWLGEATKPDTVESRFVKLTFALEAFVGGEVSHDKLNNLSTRGIAATVAERGAFIAETNPTKRRGIHDDIHMFYGIRSGVVHGGGKEVTEKELVDFASLVRTIAWALLRRIDTFTDISSLQEWVLSQRYS